MSGRQIDRRWPSGGFRNHVCVRNAQSVHESGHRFRSFWCGPSYRERSFPIPGREGVRIEKPAANKASFPPEDSQSSIEPVSLRTTGPCPSSVYSIGPALVCATFLGYLSATCHAAHTRSKRAWLQQSLLLLPKP